VSDVSIVNLNFAGGFVWIFSGDERATVGLVRAPNGSKYQHRMVLSVDRGRIIKEQTTHPEEVTGANPPTYNLEGEVRITIDGRPLPAKRLGRTVSTIDPGKGNDFFHVYRIGRLADGTPPPVRANWADYLTVRLPLSAGRLVVSEDNTQACTFEDGGGKPVAEQRDLATIIDYMSDIAAGSYVEVRADGGKVRMTATSDLLIKITAECNCGSERVLIGAPLPGFDDVFELYDERLTPQFRVIPLRATSLTAPQGKGAGGGADKKTPGPDCPPTEHPAP
jgi:hypothetical protein